MIYEILEKDHVAVKALFDQLIALDDKDETRFDLLEQIKQELIPHSRAEEAVFYNSIRALDADSGKILHSYQEHMAAETMLRTLMLKDKINLNWKATAIKLRDALAHHIHEEETEVFALARKVLSDSDSEQIGHAFESMKAKVKGEGFMQTSFELVKNLMPPKLSKVIEMRNQLH